MSRSDVPRLSQKEALVLGLLGASDGLYGLQMVADSRGGLKRGTIYVTLGRMEDKGLIRSWTEDAPESAGGLPRRLYAATPQGLRIYKAWSAFLRQLKPAVSR